MKKFTLSIIFSALLAQVFAQTPPPEGFTASNTISGDVIDMAVDHYGHTGHACIITGIENGGSNGHSAALISFIDSTGTILAQDTVVPHGGIAAYLNAAMARNFPGVFSVIVNGHTSTAPDTSSIYELEFSITGTKLSETSSLLSGDDTVSDFQFLGSSLRLFAFYNNNLVKGSITPMYGIVNTNASSVQYGKIGRKNTKTAGVTIFLDTSKVDSLAVITSYNTKTDTASINTYIINSGAGSIMPADSFVVGRGFPYQTIFGVKKIFVGIADNVSATPQASMLRFREDGLYKRLVPFAQSADPSSQFSITSREKDGTRVVFSYNNLNADTGYVVAGPKHFDTTSNIVVLRSAKNYSVTSPFRTWCNEVAKYNTLDNLAVYTSDGNLLDVNRLDSGLKDLWTGPYAVNDCAGYQGGAQIQQITNGFFLTYTTNLLAAPELTTRFEYIFENLTGVQPVSQAQKITIFPNPVSKTVLVQTHISTPVVIAIYDVTGKLIYSNANVRQQVTIDMAKFASGVYMLHVVNGNSVQTVKLVKQ
jgi:hypothetical protein